MRAPSPRVLAVLAVLALGASTALRAETLNWVTNSSGNWNAPARWITTNVPDTVTEVAIVFSLGGTTGPYYVTNSGSLYPTGLTNGGLSIGNANYATVGRGMYLVASNLDWTMGDAANPGYFLSRYAYSQFNEVNLNLRGARPDYALYLINSGEGKEWSLVATNSTITIADGVAKNSDTAPAALLVSGNYGDKPGATTPGLSMTGGGLTVTNSTTNAAIQVQGGYIFGSVTSRVARLWLKDTTLTADKLFLSSSCHFRFDAASASGNSRISNELRYYTGGGRADLLSGALTIGKITVAINCSVSNAPLEQAAFLNVSGATVNVSGDLEWSSGGFHDNNAPWEIKVWSGSVSANNLLIGGKNIPRGQYAMYLFGGSVAVSNDLWLGWFSAMTRHGSGLLEMSGGTLSCGSLIVGRSANADGYYKQTGGTATIGNTVTLYTESATYGTRQFVVATNATLILNGPGFVKSGTNAWPSSLLTPGNLDFSGTCVFDPAPGVTNMSLLAFGDDVGPAREGLALPFALGTLDISALDGAERLTVKAAGNELTNALYVARLPGLTPAAAAAQLNSALTIYYDPDASPTLGQGLSINLTGGGRLVALPSGRTPGVVILIK
jgi:hypothetical protein